jgi:ferredoxin
VTKIEIEAEKCCGAGQCVMFAPTYFDMDDAGVSFTLVDVVDRADLGAVQEAIDSCPTMAIRLVGD